MESKHQELERRFREENTRAEDATNKVKSMTSTIERLKKEGVLSQAFITEFTNVKRLSEEKEREFRNLETRFQAMERIMKALRG